MIGYQLPDWALIEQCTHHAYNQAGHVCILLLCILPS